MDVWAQRYIIESNIPARLSLTNSLGFTCLMFPTLAPSPSQQTSEPGDPFPSRHVAFRKTFTASIVALAVARVAVAVARCLFQVFHLAQLGRSAAFAFARANSAAAQCQLGGHGESDQHDQLKGDHFRFTGGLGQVRGVR